MTSSPPPSAGRLPPGPRSWIPGAVFRDLRKGPLEYLTHLTRTYGDICSFKAAGQRYVIINSPDLAREILLTQADAFWKGPALQNSKGILGEGLLTAEGDTHRSQRKLMTPAFHARHVETYTTEILRSTRDLVAQWHARKLPQWDVRPDMMGLTLVIAGNALFGTMLADEIQTVHRCMDDLMNNYYRSVVPWGWLLNLIPSQTTLKLKRARADLRALVDRMIAKRRQIKNQNSKIENAHDLLSMMIAATDEEAGDKRTGIRLNDDQLRDQSITILTAGHETTANAMTFTLYLLAKHPDEQQKLRDEICTVLGANDPAPDMLDRLPRTRWVLYESMRLLPPAWTLGRQNRREITLNGYTLPPRCTVLIPQWTLHRDPRFWPDPLAFKPDRWQSPTHPRYAYIPFSTGPRNCIGESFAWLEMLLALPLLVRDFAFSLPPRPPPHPPRRRTPAITLRPKDPVTLQITPR
jgi:cytochrome P450